MNELVNEPGKIRGVKILLGSQWFILPPLNLIGFEEHETDIERFSTEPNLKLSDKLQIICRITLSAIQRNYPDVTLEYLKKWIDLGNMLEVFQAVMAQSGLRPANPGEVMASGSTGQPSTPASALLPAGDGSTSAIN